MAGRKIDDHSSWIGKGNDINPFPMGVKTKKFEPVSGAGEIKDYPDTNEGIQSQQKKNMQKAESHKMKDGYRN